MCPCWISWMSVLERKANFTHNNELFVWCAISEARSALRIYIFSTIENCRPLQLWMYLLACRQHFSKQNVNDMQWHTVWKSSCIYISIHIYMSTRLNWCIHSEREMHSLQTSPVEYWEPTHATQAEAACPLKQQENSKAETLCARQSYESMCDVCMFNAKSICARS